jgi:hypothetical protein
MQAQWTKLEAAEHDLKWLMTEVTRVMEKAQEAVERVACQTRSTTDTHRAASSSANEFGQSPRRDEPGFHHQRLCGRNLLARERRDVGSMGHNQKIPALPCADHRSTSRLQFVAPIRQNERVAEGGIDHDWSDVHEPRGLQAAAPRRANDPRYVNLVSAKQRAPMAAACAFPR